MKKVLVVSHERSGTYLLCETIAKNFGCFASYEDRADLDQPGVMYADPEEMRNALSYWHKTGEPLADLRVKHIFKSHHPYCFFSPLWDFVREQYHVFYVTRDGRDVMTSAWRFYHKRPGFWGPRCFNVGDFMRAEPAGLLCRYHGRRTPSDMVSRWSGHVLSWLKPRPEGICHITYQMLTTNLDFTVKKIAEHLEMPAPAEPIMPEMGGILPWKGKSGNWIEYFTADDIAYFRMQENGAMQTLGFEP